MKRVPLYALAHARSGDKGEDSNVGVLAYELLMGRLPFQAADPLALALMHAQDPVPRLPAEKKHWQAFLDRAMAKSPDNRYRNAQQMLGALNQLSEGKPAEPKVDLGKLGALAKAWWKPALSTVAAFALTVAVIAWFQRERDPAQANDFFTVEDAAPRLGHLLHDEHGEHDREADAPGRQ